jgi:hypothetical protein
MNSKFQMLAQKIQLFMLNKANDIELLGAAVDLKDEVDFMVNRLIEIKNQQTKLQKVAQMILNQSYLKSIKVQTKN